MNQSVNNLNWPNVLQFLYTEHQNLALKENMWAIDRKELTDQIKEFKGKLDAQIAINEDLKNRNSMLEYSLRLLRSSGTKDAQLSKGEVMIPQRRPKPNRANLKKILCSLQIGSLLDDINKEIAQKAPQSGMRIELPSNTKKDSADRPNSAYKVTCSLEEHQDGVRDICFLPDRDFMVSVSEDATMRIWSTEKPNERIECLGTIRQHAGPIFSVVEGDGLVFTGGMEGIIRCWNFPRKYPEQSSKQCLLSRWSNVDQKKSDPVWQLIYNSEHKMLVSTSSETQIRAFKIKVDENSVESKYICSYVGSPTNSPSHEEDIPTTVCTHQQMLLAGYVNSSSLLFFDLETKKVAASVSFPSEGEVSTNRLISNDTTILGAFEDRKIRVFEREKIVHSFEAHDESVMSLCFTANPNQFFSCGQDGGVKLWDLRKFTTISSFKAHKKKYDESAHCVSASRNGIAASGGADAVIKVYISD